MNKMNHQSDPREGCPLKPVLAYCVIRRVRSCGKTREYVVYIAPYRALAERYIDEHTTGEEYLMIQPKFMSLDEYIELANQYFWEDSSK